MEKDELLRLRHDAGGGTRRSTERHLGGLASADGVAFQSEKIDIEDRDGLRAIEWFSVPFCDCGTALDGKEASVVGRCSNPRCHALTCSKCVRRDSLDGRTYCPRHARVYPDGRCYASGWVRFWRRFWCLD